MRKEIRAYFDLWLNFYGVAKDRREPVYDALDRVFDAFDSLVGPQVQKKWKENRTSSKSD